MSQNLTRPGSTRAVRHYFLVAYVLINAMAGVWMITSGELMGDLQGRPYSNSVVVAWAASLVISSYYLLLGPIYNLLDRIKVKESASVRSDSLAIDRLGMLLIVLQAAFWMFNSYYGVNIAGAGNKTDNKLLSYFFIMVDPDYLFFIYYGLYRENKYFYPNFFVWCASNLVRGWGGILLFIIFFEFSRLHALRLLSFRRMMILLSVVIFTYPILSAFKWVIRASAFSGTDYGEIFSQTAQGIGSENFFVLIWMGIEHAIGRLQVVSLLVQVMEMSSTLRDDYLSGRILPFWLDGLQGIAFDRLFNDVERDSVGVVLARYINPSFEGVGNTNLSYMGWFFIYPIFAPLYVMYTLALGIASMFFIKKIQSSGAASDMVWLVWLVYLMPPWLGAMIKFIYSAVLFLVLKILFSKFRRIKFVV